MNLVLLVISGTSLARQYQLDFDGPEPSWQVRCRQRETRLESQERRRDGARSGQAEHVRVQAAVGNSPLRVEHPLPAAQVLDELTASIWFRSDRPGATLALRIAFHGTEDPETGIPLSIIIMGDKYEDEDKWQQLKCRTADKAVNDQLRLLRARRRVPLERSTMYLDRVIIGFQLETGFTEMMIEDLELGPVVPVEFETGTDVRQTGATSADSHSGGGLPSRAPGIVPVEFRLHTLRVEGKPFFPRIAAHRGEHPGILADAGFNSVWVADLDAITNTGQYRDRGMWLTATPPFAKDADGKPLDSDDASLLPFPASSSSVLFWMLGARLTADSRPRLPSWTNQVRDADRAFKRPLAADVADDERVASRHLDMVGLSRHVLNSGLSLADYRDDMIRRRDRAWPGTFCFSWIQTEPAPELAELKTLSDEAPVLEPEQLRLQVYAALAAGCRGIGFWTTTPLDASTPGARERQLMMTQLNLELGLLEPWLATGSNVQLISFTVDSRRPDSNPSRQATSKPVKKDPEAERHRERQLSAAMIRSEFGALLLPMWLEDGSQFVPGQLAAPSATIIVPGGGETATAWLITTTGRVQNLTRETVAGGIKIILPKFDQTAAILVTSDPSMIEQINPRIAAIQERSAMVMVELCRLKLDRVRRIDQQLQQLGVGQPDSRQLLGQAKLQYEMAEAKLKQQDYHTARQYAGVALQLARILQRAHWDHAVAKLPSPMSSPYAVCFQTLPAHWRLVRSIESLGKTSDPNKLPSGEFEDLDTLIAAGWRHDERPTPDVRSAAELFAPAKQGKFSLRLAAEPTVQEPANYHFQTAPVTVRSPAVTVHSGQLIRITGWVKTPHPIVRTVDGALIYDSLLGKTGAIRILNSPDWQRFELWRIVPESQTITVTAEMHGLGEVLLDDLRITSSTLPTEVADGARTDSDVKPARFAPVDPFDLRRLNPRRDRK
jgi:hypothetical protein